LRRQPVPDDFFVFLDFLDLPADDFLVADFLSALVAVQTYGLGQPLALLRHSGADASKCECQCCDHSERKQSESVKHVQISPGTDLQ
jgi:hypothetical protein